MSDSQDDRQLAEPGNIHPSKYTRVNARERFAVAKYYGMGSDGEWTISEIADELDCSERQVYRYIHESDIGDETREVLATTEAEWRLDMAVQLRREVQRLEDIEEEMLQRKEVVPTDYETKTVQGTPLGDRNIRLDDDPQTHSIEIAVPSEFEQVTDYGTDLERVQKEKRNHLKQISKLLGLDAPDRSEVDKTLASRHEDVKIVEFRDADGDDGYPDGEVIDVDGEAQAVSQGSDDDAGDDGGDE